MTDTASRLTTVRRFQEKRPTGPPRSHVLSLYDTGQIRVVIDRSEGLATRLLAVLKEEREYEPGDGAPQIEALCDEYVNHYRRDGGPLSCRLTREHLIAGRRHQAALSAGSASDEDQGFPIAA
jgi:hypothetical protein